MSENSSNNGIGVLGLLGVAFVVLKLTDVINWSWWYVTLPFWGGLVLAFIGIIISLIYFLLKKNSSQKKVEVPKIEKRPKQSAFQQKLEDAMIEAKKRKS